MNDLLNVDKEFKFQPVNEASELQAIPYTPRWSLTPGYCTVCYYCPERASIYNYLYLYLHNQHELIKRHCA